MEETNVPNVDQVHLKVLRLTVDVVVADTAAKFYFSLILSSFNPFVILSNVQLAVRSPVTLTIVLIMSKILSTESNNKIPTGGIPTVMSIVDKTIVPAPGTAGVPIEANRDVMIITRIDNTLSSIEKSCAKKNTAIT